MTHCIFLNSKSETCCKEVDSNLKKKQKAFDSKSDKIKNFYFKIMLFTKTILVQKRAFYKKNLYSKSCFPEKILSSKMCFLKLQLKRKI